jgi:hypothetical protein
MGGTGTPDSPSGLNILGADDLFAPMPPVSWLCQSLYIAPGAPVLCAGYGYSGKSLVLQSLALAVASGSMLWGKYVVRRGKVLHLDYEQGRRITSDRYRRMVMAEGFEMRSLTGHLEAGILPQVGLDADLACRLGEHRALVLIDSWRAAHPGVDENSSEVRRTLDRLGMASEKTGAVFLVLHHTRKPQKDSAGGAKMAIRGSSGFYDGCQTVYLFDGEKVGAPVITLDKERIGGRQLDPFALQITDLESGGLMVRVAEAPGSPKEESAAETYVKVRALVLELVRGRPGTSASELAEVSGRRKSTVLAAVSSLIGEGAIVQVGRGMHTRLYIQGTEPEHAPF